MSALSITTSLRSGLIGLGFLGACIVWTAIHFKNPDGSAFNPLRNFVSELGSQKLSASSVVFNTGIVISSLLFFPVIHALAGRLTGGTRRAALITGFCAMVGAAGCGFASMDYLKPHLAAAMLYFWSWLAMTSIFTVGLWRCHSFSHARVLLLAGIVATVLAALFLTVLLIALIGFLNGAFAAPQNFQRPEVWDIAVLEWCVVASFIAWMLGALAHLHKTRPIP